MKKINTEQKQLAELIKIEKIKQKDFCYHDLADMIDISIQSFYNWLSGAYNLSYEKYIILQDWYYCRKD